MAFNYDHIKKLTIAVLTGFNLHCKSSEKIVLGTIAHETLMGTHLYQLGDGPGLGIGSIEPDTFNWLKDKYKDTYPILCNAEPEDLVHDLRLSILMIRLRYKVSKTPLPKADDLRAIAQYWKVIYNTRDGKGTPDEFISNYKRYCK